MTMKPIYLDYMSTTPLDSRVTEAMSAVLHDKNAYGNAHSQHVYGRYARELVEKARSEIADLLNTTKDSLIFTSGATEANNLAIQGVAYAYRRQGKHLITTSIEHKSVLNTFKYLENSGFKVTYLKPNLEGLIEPETLQKALQKDTILVSIGHANNEIGTIQALNELANLIHQNGALFHVDAAQSFGKISLNLAELPIDLLSLSAHKIYGPKGIGALYLRQQPKIHLVPLFYGGNQEQHMRSGTLATHQIVGFGAACRLLKTEMTADYQHQLMLQNRLLSLLKNFPTVKINGSIAKRLAGNLNFSVAGLPPGTLANSLTKIAFSTTSACYADCLTTRQPAMSYVLEAIQISHSMLTNSVRLSWGRMTSEHEFNEALLHIKETLTALTTP